MIFGRKRKAAVEPEEVEAADAVEDDEEAEEEAVDAEEETSDEHAEWLEWDAAFDREEAGPFDFSEVDLEADDVKRIDFGTLIATPFPNMKLQFRAVKETNEIQALLVGDGASALEVAVFAGPMRTSMIPEIRDDMIAATEKGQGRTTVQQGPLGSELLRRVPVKDPKGNAALHVSRTWLVDGPGWVLRGIVMGKAAIEPENEDAQVALYEFFSNLVVRRGTQPAAPGSILHMTVPDLKQQENVAEESDEDSDDAQG